MPPILGSARSHLALLRHGDTAPATAGAPILSRLRLGELGSVGSGVFGRIVAGAKALDHDIADGDAGCRHSNQSASALISMLTRGGASGPQTGLSNATCGTQ